LGATAVRSESILASSCRAATGPDDGESCALLRWEGRAWAPAPHPADRPCTSLAVARHRAHAVGDVLPAVRPLQSADARCARLGGSPRGAARPLQINVSPRPESLRGCSSAPRTAMTLVAWLDPKELLALPFIVVVLWLLLSRGITSLGVSGALALLGFPA